MKPSKELLNKIYDEFTLAKMTYDKMQSYYEGKTDAIQFYKMVTERSSNKINVNYLKKFIKEEVSYSVGNDVKYISKSGDIDILKDIDYYIDHWSELHDVTLCKKMLITSLAFELYYIDNNAGFSCMIVPANEGIALKDDNGTVTLFMRVFKKPFIDKTFIDVYVEDKVYHYNDDFNEIKNSEFTGFSSPPVGIAELSEESINDTLYNDIKGLQDAYETNLSDISNEISDFRNAYLTFIGSQIDENDLTEMKKLGIIHMPNKEGKVEWLIKNINDTFIQNTLNTIEGKIYEISSHINHNEKMQSNTSSLALRSRLISLEEKCKLNQKALSDCIKTRLQFLFEYLQKIKKKEYDFRDIKIKFTPNIPQDDLMAAQIINLLQDLISQDTALSLLSFIESSETEKSKVKNELRNLEDGLSKLNGVELDESNL